MWGSSFADLAKKAAELQEQASTSLSTPGAVSSFTTSAGGLFNMDALQEDDNKGNSPNDTQQPSMISSTQQQRQQSSTSASSSSSFPSISTSSFDASSLLGGTSASMMFGASTPTSTTPSSSTTTAVPKKPTSQQVKTPPKSKLATPKTKLPTLDRNGGSSTTSVAKKSDVGGTSLRVPNSMSSTTNTTTPTKGKLRMPTTTSTTTTTKTISPTRSAAVPSSNNVTTTGSALLSKIPRSTPTKNSGVDDKATVSTSSDTSQQMKSSQQQQQQREETKSSSTTTTTDDESKHPIGGTNNSSDNSKNSSRSEDLTTQNVHTSADDDINHKTNGSSSLPSTIGNVDNNKSQKVEKEKDDDDADNDDDLGGGDGWGEDDDDLDVTESEEFEVPEPTTTTTTMAALPEETISQDNLPPSSETEKSNKIAMTTTHDDTPLLPSLPSDTTPQELPLTSSNSDNTELNGNATSEDGNVVDKSTPVENNVKENIPKATERSVPPPISTMSEVTSVAMDHDDDDDPVTTTGSIPPTPTAPLSMQGGVLYRGSIPVNNTDGKMTTDTLSCGGMTDGEKELMQKQFSDQLERLEQNHQAEQALQQQEFNQTLADITAQLQQRESFIEQQQAERIRFEADYERKLTALQRDLRKTKELLSDKEKEDRRLQEAHLHQLRDMEKQMNRKEDTSQGLEQQMQVLQKAYDEAKADVKKSEDDYAALKERAKTVAGELKERRIECRTLASEIDLLQGKNGELQERITQLEAQGLDMNQSSKETMDELESLRSKLKEMEQLVSDANSSIEVERKKGEDALAAYKKKAQQSLALANSRAAAAVQSKEEAELEARAARTTADSAMQRALSAEAEGKRATAEASSYVKEMEQEVSKYSEVKASLEAITKELETTRSESSKFQDTAEKLQCELTSVSGRLEAEQATNQSLKQSVAEAQERSTELYNELERLRREGVRNQDEIRRLSEVKKEEVVVEAKPSVPARNAEAEATISMLKQELEDANQAIKDLKETLKITMEERDATSPRAQPAHNAMNGDSNGGMPLFYAMEKQAELTQARDEIARLANLLGDAESTKQEALENMEEMKHLMEDAQSRLRRQEQLKQNPEEESVNLEYLKNIMLSYLNAKTVQEKKALLPVLGTVLCLTPEEQRKAMEGLEKGESSVIDSVATSVLNLKWN